MSSPITTMSGNCAGSCQIMLNGLGQEFGFACSFRGYFSYQIPSSIQMQVYQHFKDPKKAKQLFLTSRRREDCERATRSELEELKVKLTFESLWEWAIAGYPGTWEAWWDRWWKMRVEDHEKPLAWLSSISP